MNSHSRNQTDQDALRPAPSSLIKIQQPLVRKHLFWLLVISGLVFWGCTLFTNQMDIPTEAMPSVV